MSPFSQLRLSYLILSYLSHDLIIKTADLFGVMAPSATLADRPLFYLILSEPWPQIIKTADILVVPSRSRVHWPGPRGYTKLDQKLRRTRILPWDNSDPYLSNSKQKRGRPTRKRNALPAVLSTITRFNYNSSKSVFCLSVWNRSYLHSKSTGSVWARAQKLTKRKLWTLPGRITFEQRNVHVRMEMEMDIAGGCYQRSSNMIKWIISTVE